MSKFIEELWELGPQFVEGTPHAKNIGIKFVAVDNGRATMALPYNENLIGDTDTQVIHGGAVTTLLDQASGLAAIAGFNEPLPVATLSLRIDYMRAAVPNTTLIGEAHCYKTTKHVAFIRAVAHDGDADDPVATAQACFMVTGKKLTLADAAKPQTPKTKTSKAKAPNTKAPNTKTSSGEPS